MEMKTIYINKNRGWRGLAEVEIYNTYGDLQMKRVFSFSQNVWDDMLKRLMVVQDEDYYYVITFEKALNDLPKPSQQRSVLIKNFVGNITNVNRYEKETWDSPDIQADDYWAIKHFLENKNNHTTSKWNYVGVRVVPNI